MNCKICNSISNHLFSGRILNKYNIGYFRCADCGFIQTEDPYWLKDAYANPIHTLDVGLVNRNIVFSNFTARVLNKCKIGSKKFLDYGGGYGLFVRLMRDKGYDFYYLDEYSENIFSKDFTLAELKPVNEFGFLTAYEVFEHIPNPLTEIIKMFNYSNSILFTTQLIPETKISKISDWWYFMPETGQHISFYTKKTLEVMAKVNNANFFSNGYLHMITKEEFNSSHLQYNIIIKMFCYLSNRLCIPKNKVNRCAEDFELIKAKYNSSS